jgi:Holliday junction resolvase RusA-like endonuclease
VISFDIPGDPRGKGRPRFAKRGKFVQTYTDDKTAAYENLVALACREAMQGSPAYECPMAVGMIATFKVPASASIVKRDAMLNGSVRPTKLPDLDNILKAVLDGCNQIAFRDDALVVQIAAAKQYGAAPGVRVTLTPLEH